MCVSGKVWGSSFGEADGMFGSILGGSHAYKSLDVVLLQHRGNTHKRWKVSENEGEKNEWQKVKVGWFGKKECLFCCLLPLSLCFSTWVIVACRCFRLCREAHLFLSLLVSSQNAFLNHQIKAGTSKSFLWHRWLNNEIISAPNKKCVSVLVSLSKKGKFFHRLSVLTLGEKHGSLFGRIVCWRCIVLLYRNVMTT